MGHHKSVFVSCDLGLFFFFPQLNLLYVLFFITFLVFLLCLWASHSVRRNTKATHVEREILFTLCLMIKKVIACWFPSEYITTWNRFILVLWNGAVWVRGGATWILCPQVTPSSQWNSAGVGGERMSWQNFSHLNSPSQCFPPWLVRFFFPLFLRFFISQTSPHFRLFLQSSPELTPPFPPNILTPVSPLPFPQAFFNDKYMQEHPEDFEKIEKLKDLIAWQVRLKFRMHVRMITVKRHAIVCKASVCLAKGWRKGFKEMCHDLLIANYVLVYFKRWHISSYSVVFLLPWHM